MPAMNGIKHRIASTKQTRQITNAMQMVSTAKLNRIQKHTKTYDEYASRVKSVVMHLAQSHLLDNSSSNANSQDDNSSGKTAYLVITSDRGMVGSYNSNVIRETNNFMEQHTPNSDDRMILAVGGNGADFYRQRGENVAYENRSVPDIPTFGSVKEIINTINSMYNDQIFSELYVCYSHFVNRMTSSFRAEKMLPMDSETLSGDKSNDISHESVGAEYDIEPDESTLVNVVIPQYAESLIFGSIIDGKTSEHSSSATAMSSASDNADDMIGDLQLQYNRARQAAITTEINEISGGQEALKN